ncbi:hypothetical protein AQI95_09810 [Streptomyces yokosukanensis]|uniref:DUF8175 domain-containing protein n=1 Tax=Streptomyces yokosukanensis TaxID=67386 RepID=A0A101PAZ0_9ACTN|nr:hypothetical protein [Streptomyces yokosukanensis]KUN08197.1 hypothetical protein AQI95_09810 [Streptomyces yokosukanensis]
MNPGDEQAYSDYGGDTGHTRTRLPEGDPYGGAPRRGPRRSSSRGLVTVVGVVVLLIAAIAFANRGDHSSTTDSTSKNDKPAAAPTAASGTRPVDTKSAGVPAGFAHTEQGVQSAASNYAVALGSTGMFKKDSRDNLLHLLYTSAAVTRLQGAMDQAYSTDFLAKMGLDAAGNAPKGSTFVSRVVPVGTTVQSYTDADAKVAVWYVGLIGMADSASTDPVTSSWKTWTFDLQWSDGDWKIASDTQQNGPAPVPGDDKAATSDEISKAIEEYGGFTYAR